MRKMLMKRRLAEVYTALGEQVALSRRLRRERNEYGASMLRLGRQLAVVREQADEELAQLRARLREIDAAKMVAEPQRRSSEREDDLWVVVEFLGRPGHILYRHVVAGAMNLSCVVPEGARMLLLEQHRRGEERLVESPRAEPAPRSDDEDRLNDDHEEATS